MIPLAHIGGIPVEEWLPFVVPVVAVYLYVRRRERRRRAEVAALLAAGAEMSEPTARSVLERWERAKLAGLSTEHLPLLSPPGPDGASALELAARTGADAEGVGRVLEDLTELGYLERAEGTGAGAPRFWLTAEGFAAAKIAEDAALEAFAAIAPAAGGAVGRSAVS